MKISVVIPVYQVEKYLRQCLESVLNQSYPELEVLLVDDASFDGSAQICEEYASRDARVTLIHKHNGGLSDSRNTGIRAASGQYVLFVDSDDWLADEGDIAALAERAKASAADVVSFSYEKIYEKSQRVVPCLVQDGSMPLDLKTKHEQLEYLSLRGLYVASACNKLIGTGCLREHGLFFTVGDTAEDVVWCLRLLVACRSLDYVNRSVYRYRQREGSISQSLNAAKCNQLARHIPDCAVIAEQARPGEDAYLRYSAYQLATFMKVLSYAEVFPRDSVELLKEKARLLRYHAGNTKVKLLWMLSRSIGFTNSCKLLYLLLWRNHSGG